MKKNTMKSLRDHRQLLGGGVAFSVLVAALLVASGLAFRSPHEALSVDVPPSPLALANSEFGVEPYGPDYARRQAAISEVVESVDAEVSVHPQFSGMFIDNDAGTVLVIRAVGDWPYFEAIADKYSNTDRQIVVRPADYSFSELDVLQALVVSDTPMWRERGILVEHVGVDPVGNRVDVGVADLTPDGESALVDHYGARIAVRSTEAAVAMHCVTNTLFSKPICTTASCP